MRLEVLHIDFILDIEPAKSVQNGEYLHGCLLRCKVKLE